MSKLYLATNEDVGDKSLVENLIDKGFNETPITKILDDIALAIQNKEGTTDYIPANEMADRITNLPSGQIRAYTPLSFIESNGSQYIDTDFKPSGDTRIELTILKVTNGANIFGVWDAWQQGMFGMTNDGSKSFVAYGSTYTNPNLISDDRHTIIFDKNTVTIDGDDMWTTTLRTFNVAHNLTLFKFNKVGTGIKSYADEHPGFTECIRLESLKIYDKDNLIRNYIPCRLNDYMENGSLNEIGLWDLVNGVFFANKGTGTFIGGNEIINLPSDGGHDLPKKYKELKSIKTDGGQYITIEQNFAYNKDVEIYADYKFDGFTQDWSLLIGNATQQFWIGANKNYLAYAFGGGDVKIKDFDTEKHHCELRNGSQKFDGDIIGTKTITNTVYQPLVLFAESSTTLGYVGEFYSMEIYRGDSTIHSFVPCYRIEDDVVGIYDLITNTFYANQGTGSFVKGAFIGVNDLQSGGINYSMEEQDTGLILMN